jgi:hypothetical protein
LLPNRWGRTFAAREQKQWEEQRGEHDEENRDPPAAAKAAVRIDEGINHVRRSGGGGGRVNW